MKKSQLYKRKADNKTGWVSITWPKVYPAPRGEIPQPHRSSGSDHKRSHMGPSWGTSWTRSKFRMLSRVSMDGDSPPCRQNISDSTYKFILLINCLICNFVHTHTHIEIGSSFKKKKILLTNAVNGR